MRSRMKQPEDAMKTKSKEKAARTASKRAAFGAEVHVECGRPRKEHDEWDFRWCPSPQSNAPSFDELSRRELFKSRDVLEAIETLVKVAGERSEILRRMIVDGAETNPPYKRLLEWHREVSDCSCCDGTGDHDCGADCHECDGTGKIFPRLLS